MQKLPRTSVQYFTYCKSAISCQRYTKKILSPQLTQQPSITKSSHRSEIQQQQPLREGTSSLIVICQNYKPLLVQRHSQEDLSAYRQRLTAEMSTRIRSLGTQRAGGIPHKGNQHCTGCSMNAVPLVWDSICFPTRPL